MPTFIVPCDLVAAAQFLVGVLATIAAGSWLRASRIRLPPADEAGSDRLMQIATRLQAQWNTTAAAFAAGSALIQAVLAFFPACPILH
jgi:hypothetical protein